jgi:5'(3')-deoxyribonucleotidase
MRGLNDVKTWHVFEGLGLDKTFEDSIYALMESDQWCLKLPLLPGAQDGIVQLREFADVYFVTAPLRNHPTWAHERMDWLNLYFGAEPNDVISTSAKHCVAGDALVDDKTSTLQAWNACHPNGLGIRWISNRTIEEAYDGVMTEDWTETAELIRQKYYSEVANRRYRSWWHAV